MQTYKNPRPIPTFFILLFFILQTSCSDSLQGATLENPSSGTETATDTPDEVRNPDRDQGFEGDDLVVDIKEPIDEGDETVDEPDRQHLCSDPRLVADVPLANNPLSGTQVRNQVQNLTGASRDRLLLQNMYCGNRPTSLTRLQPVRVSFKGETITFCVSPDYFAVGEQNSAIRFPLGLPAAYELLGSMGFILPTRKMVNLIYQQAEIKVAPRFMTPGPQMESTGYINTHNNTLNGQLGGISSQLSGGHKKDVVISNRLVSRPNRIAIYGWHQLNGDPIQPLSTVHHLNYADYSQGVRFVSDKAFIGESMVEIKDILNDSNYASALSDEGVISSNVLNKFRRKSFSCQ
jgi:hypothetical protein